MHEGRNNRNLGRFFALAFVLHAAGLPLMGPFLPGSGEPKAPPKRVRIISLRTAGTTAAAAKRKTKATPPKKQVKAPKKKPKEKKYDTKWREKKQVFVPPSLDTEAPKDSRFVSEFNTKTERETISRHAVKNPERVLNERSVGEKHARPKTDSGKASPQLSLGAPKAKATSPGAPAPSSRLEIPNIRLADKQTLRLDPNGVLQNQVGREKLLGNSFRLRLRNSDEGIQDPRDEGRRSPIAGEGEKLNLVPDVAVLARLTGNADLQLIDADIEEGEGTFLNSSAFKYGGFFRRVRQRIAHFWNPVRELQRRDPTGNVFGRKNRITELTLTLDRIGTVQKVHVSKTCGLDFLDQEAVSALQKARQFPNLPKGLLSASNTFTFSFRFHVVRNEGGSYRLPF